MSDTGGGHRSAAEAIASALTRAYPGKYEVTLVDGIVRAALFPFNHTPSWYLPTVTYAESGWGLLFHTTNAAHMRRPTRLFINAVTHRGLVRLFRTESADLVLSVHPLLTSSPRRVLRELGSSAPFVITVTDLFDAHGLWFDPGADLCLVPTEGARVRAQRQGMPDDKLRVVGLPVSLKFLEAATNKAEQRARLGLAQDLATVLLVGGGEGMGRLEEIAHSIARRRLPMQLVVIAGRNLPLYRRLKATLWEIPVHVQGFVTNMPDWMHASDVLITKAGPGTISEGLACGLPVLLSGFLPGQEAGNVTFVEQSGAGILRRDPEEIADTLADWFEPGNPTLARLAACARALGRPRAALEVARILDNVLTGHETKV